MTAAASPAPQNAYDEVPYGSFPFSQTNPSSIRAIGHLFGLNAPAPSTARILELGCASGNNILAIAARFPDAQCLGIDLSEAQIAEGKQRIEEMGIKNLRLEQKSILDIDKAFGEFDYIICHGVLSWVPRIVQHAILEVCSQNLAENGIAYVSYNTLPGWSGVAAIREMMLYHTARFSDPRQKAEQARLLLKFLRESVSKGNSRNFYADILENEDNILAGQSDWYLLHDHLEEHNTPYYFHQFMEIAAANNLQYLAETTLPTMFSGNLPEETAKVLATSDDIVRSEQYMDFIYNRRFRSTLLCHKDRVLRRALNPADIREHYFTSQFGMPEDFANYKLGSGVSLTFGAQNNMVLTTDNPGMIAALMVLSEQNGKPMAMKALCSEIAKRLTAQGLAESVNEEELATTLAGQFLRSIFIGGIVLHLDAEEFAVQVADKPKLFPLAAYQAGKQEWVTSLRQTMHHVSEFDVALMRLLNGKNDIKALTKALLPLFLEDKLSMNVDQQKITDKKQLEAKLPEAIRGVLQRYAQMALLVE